MPENQEKIIIPGFPEDWQPMIGDPEKYILGDHCGAGVLPEFPSNPGMVDGWLAKDQKIVFDGLQRGWRPRKDIPFCDMGDVFRVERPKHLQELEDAKTQRKNDEHMNRLRHPNDFRGDVKASGAEPITRVNIQEGNTMSGKTPVDPTPQSKPGKNFYTGKNPIGPQK